jgi:hypothetical protein
MHRHELKSKGRDTKDWATKSHGMAQSSRAERWNGTASQRTGMLRKGIAGRSKGYSRNRNAMQGNSTGSQDEQRHNKAIHRFERTSKGNEVRRIDTQVRSEEGRAPKSKNKNEKEKATCRKSK